jgi:xanthine/CO dehydrogenase XdhC/CoxF family maturation factor
LSKEIQQIIEKLNTFAPNETAILATVVDVAGSGYRRPGARMLIDKNGFGIGTVSGGCLEADVLERAKKVLQTGDPVVITYDTTKDEDSVFGLGMGCRGIVRILLESVKKDSPVLKSFQIAHEIRERQLLATLISSDKISPVGGRVFYSEVEQFYNFNFPTNLNFHNQLIKDCEMLYLANSGSLLNTYFTEDGNYEIFFEVINPPLNFMLFGAGYDALPLIKFAKELGWRVSAVDHRPAFANAERLPEADEIFTKNVQDLDDAFFQDENSVAVIMTHNYDRDREILPRLLNSQCLYVGALGPKKRTEKILAETNETFSATQLEKLHAPVGLDIGADTPEAIALSIVAEIQAVLKNREGGFLRRRQGSIYARSE